MCEMAVWLFDYFMTAAIQPYAWFLQGVVPLNFPGHPYKYEMTCEWRMRRAPTICCNSLRVKIYEKHTKQQVRFKLPPPPHDFGEL